MITTMNYGKAFRQIREEQGLSRSEVSKKIGCTPSALCKIENGQVLPKKATIAAFCLATKTPVARLCTLSFEAHDFWSY